MKKSIIVLLAVSAIVFMAVFGCTKSNPSTPATATNTPAPTLIPTSTPPASPNLSGTITFPAEANGKQYAVVVDDDANTANGSVAVVLGVVNSTGMAYAFSVAAATYYVYAYVDMNNSGMTGPAGLDYTGSYNSWGTVAAPATGVDFTCTDKLNITITINVTIPADAAGRDAYFGFFTDKTIEAMMTPVAGTSLYAPSGTAFTVSFEVDPADTGTYYLLGFVNAVPDCVGEQCFPGEGDYIKAYGGTGIQWPASPNYTVSGDATLSMILETVTANVSGTATLPGAANNNNYMILASTVPLGPGMETAFLITKTAQAGAGSTINYSMYVLNPRMYYLTLMVDMDGSGWNNAGTGPVNIGDYVGAYGVSVPIRNWGNPFPFTPNANLPGTGFNFDCDIMPDMSGMPPTPTPVFTPDSSGGTGTISGNVTIPSGQNGKTLQVMVDMDLNPSNSNMVATFTVTLGSGTSQSYTITGVPAAASAYYVYAATMGSPGPPLIGDAVGVYGTTFPAFPASPNVSVTSGGTTTANISMVLAAANVSGRVYMPATASVGSLWGVVIDTDGDGGNGGQLAMAVGAIGSSQTYFDYSMFLPLPGDYYIYAVVDSADPRDLISNGPSCGDYIGFYNYPTAFHMTPGGSYTNININANMGAMLCP